MEKPILPLFNRNKPPDRFHLHEIDQSSILECLAKEKRKRVMVVDDEKNFRCILSEALSMMGYEVLAFSNSLEALNCFQDGSIDLVLTDLQMPEMDGWTLARHIKKKSPSVPIILVTGEDKQAISEELGKAPIDRALYKPFSLKEIEESVREFIDAKEETFITHA